ncbi:MAG: type I methionyl aminopeptidase [Candidatus Sungbacteria bacterium RIFCSPLOWO2_01_FULL_59_16]|uniref:Methionine aminopeptidase n=1 Tax=Candidatus Sungbacteria bacterium RIFCSPLOWO2_01_FULL_59_16 TaxID=1802280 RepID=A0A1G2LBQ5_9BACT|nr:MAG: type I methionyl aminopeptidase [Candidatus Sungbacteria bacterium RIFCSPLOWO2_01_FULL_59_16]
MLREGGRRLAAILREVQKAAAPGVSTAELDRLAGRLIADAGGAPVFKGYRSRAGERPYPASICTSVNDEVVHAIPHEDQLLRNGDILGIDIGMRYPAADGLVTDAAVTVPVGKVPPRAAKLIAAARRALEVGVAVLAPGIRLGDLGAAIQGEIERDGFGVVRELVGHGVGKRLHEDPYVPNYGRPGEGRAIPEGMVLAIEPMAVLGDPAVKLDADGWTWRTKDGSLAAHFEHTVIVTKERAEVLTRE